MIWADARDWLIEAATTPGVTSAFFLVLFVHAWVSLGIGRFGPARTTTWVLLIAGGTLVQALIFLDYVLPWGQTPYWLATVPHAAWLERAAGFWPPEGAGAAAIAVLAADMAVAYFGLWRTRRPREVLWRVAVAALLAVIVDGIVARPTPAAPSADLLTPAHLLPGWYFEPLYALLRCLPAKLAGVALAAAACLIPAVWPWRSRTRGMIAVFRWAFWVALAIAWTGLGAIGSRPPGFYPVAAIWSLAAYYFAFFLLPLVRRPLLRRGVHAETSG